MKYFLVEGIVTHPEKMTDKMMREHQEYTGRLMKEGKVLFSSLKSDMSASVTVVKEDTEKQVNSFYRGDPFYTNDVITYAISELQIHYRAADIANWYEK